MNMKQHISSILPLCEESERALIERLIIAAGDYVSSVTVMEATAMNIPERKGEALRTAVSETDTARHAAHDALITYTNIVNRICAKHAVEPLYAGSDMRRDYGDFALKLVTASFEARQ